MRYIKYILFILIIFLVPNVYAQEFNVSSSDVTCPLTSGSGKYCGAEVYYTGTSGAFNLGTRYDGRLNRIWFNLIAGGYADANGFEQGHTYTVTMNMATNDWNNKFGSLSVKCDGSSGAELKKGGITYVSYKKIKFSFQAPANDWCQFVYVDIRASSGNTITQISNWNLSSLTISDSAYDSGSGSGSSPTPTSDPNQSIIDNQNQNTTDIIDNQNQNTNDIIDNINEASTIITNTFDDMLGNKCLNLFDKNNITENSTFDSSGNIFNSNGFFLSNNYISVKPNTTYSLDSYSGYRVAEYNDNFNFIERLFDVKSFTTSSNTFYIRLSGLSSNLNNVMLVEGSTSKPYCEFGSSESKIDELNDKLDGLGRVIEDSQVDDKSSFFTGFQDNNHGLTGIITAPLSTIQGLANSSCVALSIPIPFTSESVSLPCMTEVYQNYVPSVFNIWQIVSFGLISYFICIDIFKMVKGFKDPNEDKVEVLDL